MRTSPIAARGARAASAAGIDFIIWLSTSFRSRAASSGLTFLRTPVATAPTRGLFLASHVVPLASDDVDEEAAAVIDRISAAMSAEDLVDLNARSVEEKAPAAEIATAWLEDEDLL